VKQVLHGAIWKGRHVGRFLFTTDGFDPYAWAVKAIFRMLCVYGQVIKKRRKNRVTRVKRKLLVGTESQLEKALFYSEESSTLNTSFVERHNLTIRQGSAYLCRRSACHARQTESLEDHLALLQCYYNFVRSHRALKFGTETRTPAMQAGLVSKRLTFREIFTGRLVFFLCLLWVTRIGHCQLDMRRRLL
jgi:hypothetical protein